MIIMYVLFLWKYKEDERSELLLKFIVFLLDDIV